MCSNRLTGYSLLQKLHGVLIINARVKFHENAMCSAAKKMGNCMPKN
jgi:hypothetical protein